MTQAKQIPAKDLTEYFLKNRDAKSISRNSELTDEFSFDLFNKTNNYIPVVFIKSNDNEMPNWIEIENPNFLSKSGIDNDSKMVKANVLQALLKNAFPQKQLQDFIISGKRKKTRLLVKRGVAHVALLYNNIALIYTKDKFVYVIGADLQKYAVDKTLAELEEELDSSVFFRANRQYIVNLNFIRSFKVYQKVKLLLDMDVPGLEEPVIISQHVAPAFKKWMNDA